MSLRRPIVHARIRDGRLEVHAPYSIKEISGGVAGASWSKALRCWVLPLTPQAAVNVVEHFEHNDCEVKRSDVIDDLVRQHELALAVGDHIKASEDLPEVPVTLNESWPHQRQAFWFAKDLPAAMLAMDMGCGKSKVTIDLLNNNDARRVCVVAPPSVVDVWPKEIRKHSCYDWVVCALGKGVPTDRRLEEFTAVCNSDAERVMIVLNYEACHRAPLKKWLKKQQWDYFIMDESHRAKSPIGITSKSCRDIGTAARRRLALTGTPFPQTPLDIFGQYRALDSTIFGVSWTAFKKKYGRWGGQLEAKDKIFLGMRKENEEELNGRFYSIAFRVEADEVLDLPEPVPDMQRFCHIIGDQAKVYKAVEDDFHAWLDDGAEVTVANAMVKVGKLQQITGGGVKDDDAKLNIVGTAKQELLADTFADIGADEKVVVFAKHHHDLDVIAKVTAELGRPYGEVSGRDNCLVEAHLPEIPSMVCGVQIQAGGVGIDLSASMYGIYYSVGHSLSDYLQSRRRILRPGQTRRVRFIHLIASGTVDVDVYEALDKRLEVVDHVLNVRRSR
jgi:SNF2 family DNA or RNA helicase